MERIRVILILGALLAVSCRDGGEFFPADCWEDNSYPGYDLPGRTDEGSTEPDNGRRDYGVDNYVPECTYNGQCADGFVCIERECVPMQSECVSDNDCPDGRCLNGSCVECIEDTDCPGNQDCNNHYCVPETCTPSCFGKECGSNGCGGTCGTCDPGTTCDAVNGNCVRDLECTSDNDCPDGRCHNGACVECILDTDCPGNQDCIYDHCVPETCTPSCFGKECGSNECGGTCGTCDPGTTCDAGICVPDPSPTYSVTCHFNGYIINMMDPGTKWACPHVWNFLESELDVYHHLPIFARNTGATDGSLEATTKSLSMKDQPWVLTSDPTPSSVFATVESEIVGICNPQPQYPLTKAVIVPAGYGQAVTANCGAN